MDVATCLRGRPEATYGSLGGDYVSCSSAYRVVAKVGCGCNRHILMGCQFNRSNIIHIEKAFIYFTSSQYT